MKTKGLISKLALKWNSLSKAKQEFIGSTETGAELEQTQQKTVVTTRSNEVKRVRHKLGPKIKTALVV